ncbi:uncharacterized protein LOC129585809 isoform X2 [Paramacrobiotus metropolitanus]|uniref:uncharacterized protein LOC129585809 isoform X2 n=1 Tax=Paramacrobiotus metropolitanus TaxID=2943436 RepID=UPI0024458AD6|nr:uncharacterized protein LOC129585809 isoform X2 [Paramacrobiotus metropolitanus]
MPLSENSDLSTVCTSSGPRRLPRRFNFQPTKYSREGLTSPGPSEFSSFTENDSSCSLSSRSRCTKRKYRSSSSRNKENYIKRRKPIRALPIRRTRTCSRSLHIKSRSAPRHHSVLYTGKSTRQLNIKKRKAFLDRIRAQEPDVEIGCVVRSSESDDVLIAEHKTAISAKTLAHGQHEITSVARLTNSFIGRGGFGEVSAWQITTKDGKVHRVAVKCFDAQDEGLKLAEAEAAVMMEFEQLLNSKLLLWFVPRRLRCFPKDFPYPAIIMPLYENRKCISPSLYNLVFDKRLIRPTIAWILRTAILLLRVLVKLHSAGWAHGDLHAGNVMLTNREIVLIDFSKANRKNRPYIYSLVLHVVCAYR